MRVTHEERTDAHGSRGLRVVGQTTDGKVVVEGVYRFFETHGLPLDVLLDRLRSRGIIPSWLSFYDEARKAGMKHERILSKLSESLGDVYGPSFRDVVIKRLDEAHR